MLYENKAKEYKNPFNKYRRTEYSAMMKELATFNNVGPATPADGWFKRMAFRKLTIPHNVEIMKKHGVDILKEIKKYKSSLKKKASVK